MGMEIFVSGFQIEEQSILSYVLCRMFEFVKEHKPLYRIRTYLLTHSLTHSMEQSPSWEANRFSAR